uniref:ABC transporter domain-containing protein n=1 Tax=Mesocestoides corti TaxID=53468 RepID=A0A5K3EY94_MESCO
MKPGLNAIIGPTGCGKTTLLDILAGRSDPSLVSGVVLVNGKDRPPNFKRTSAYVSQDNFAMGSLTVRENLYFSAALRLPVWVSHKDREARVTALLTKLGLISVADVKVGTELVRGISGGERKRTNIGIELITDPCIIFLDEPTTGLDTFTASKLMKLLKSLSAEGKTIIASIHQPNSSIYKLFDSLTLLCNGYAIYNGPIANDAPINFFRGLGYKVSARENPADFFIDLLYQDLPEEARSQLQSGEDEDEVFIADKVKRLSICPSRMKQLQSLFEASSDWSFWISEAKYIYSVWRNLQKPPKPMSRECSSSHFHSASGSEAELSPLMANPRKSKSTTRQVNKLPNPAIPDESIAELTSLYDEVFVNSSKGRQSEIFSRTEVERKGLGLGCNEKEYRPIPMYRQFAILASRGFLDTMRNPNGAAVHFIGVALFTLLLGTVYYQMGFSSEAGIQNRAGLFYFLCLELAYFNGNCVDIFVKDWAKFKHERACGFYQTSTYFLAKVLCEVLPVKLGPILLFFPMLYGVTGLRREVGALLFWELSCLCMGTAAAAIVTFSTVLFNHVALGYAVGGIMLSFMMTFGGFLLNVVSAWWLGWCRYLSIFWYTFSAMSINEMKGMQFCSKVKAFADNRKHTSPFAESNFTVGPAW